MSKELSTAQRELKIFLCHLSSEAGIRDCHWVIWWHQHANESPGLIKSRTDLHVRSYQDRQDHSTSKEPMNLLWIRVRRFLWCTMIWKISGQWSCSGSSQKKALQGCNLSRTNIRDTHRQFSENICSEDDLRSRIFGNIFCKISCLPAFPKIFEHLKNGTIVHFK